MAAHRFRYQCYPKKAYWHVNSSEVPKFLKDIYVYFNKYGPGFYFPAFSSDMNCF